MWLLCATPDYRNGDETACRQKKPEFWNVPACGICWFLRVKWRIWQLQSRRTLVHTFILLQISELLRRKVQSSSPPYMFHIQRKQAQNTRNQTSVTNFPSLVIIRFEPPNYLFMFLFLVWDLKHYLTFTLDLTNGWLNLWVCTLKASQQGSRKATVRGITWKTISHWSKCSQMQEKTSWNKTLN